MSGLRPTRPAGCISTGCWSLVAALAADRRGRGARAAPPRAGWRSVLFPAGRGGGPRAGHPIGLQAAWQPAPGRGAAVGLPTCRSTCGWMRCRVSSCCCSAPPRPASRCSPPATSAGRGHAARPAVPAVSRVPRQHGDSCCLPTTPTCSWSRGRRWRCPRIFLVTTNHRHRRDPQRRLPVPADRAHRRDRASCCASACCRAAAGDFTFDAMRAQHLTPVWAAVAFLLALFGFGAKAGLCRCTSGCPKRIPPRRRRCRR